MSLASPTPRARSVGATLTGALLVTGALALAGPSAVLGAQGDNEVVISVIEQASPAVVTIQVPASDIAVSSDGSGPDGEDPQGEAPQDGQLPDDLEGLLPEGFQMPEGFEMPEGFQMPEGFRMGGSGSGVIVGDGIIITNGHVVDGATDVDVVLSDGSVLKGTVHGVDTLTDFAFVTVDAQDLPTVPLGDSSAVRVGQLAVVIGNPLGQFPNSASAGIVSGLDRSLSVYDIGTGEVLNHLIQVDAAVNPGNSGGAVLDGDGRLIGITTAQAGLSDGIGFALPIDLAKPIIDQVQAGEPIARPYIGVMFREIDAQVAADEDLPVETGAWVQAGAQSGEAAVVEGSPADDAGVQDGDIITAVDGTPVDLANPLDLQILKFAPGAEVTLTVLRDGETLELPTTLGTRPADLRS